VISRIVGSQSQNNAPSSVFSMQETPSSFLLDLAAESFFFSRHDGQLFSSPS
jgi:hypothetical protein